MVNGKCSYWYLMNVMKDEWTFVVKRYSLLGCELQSSSGIECKETRGGHEVLEIILPHARI